MDKKEQNTPKSCLLTLIRTRLTIKINQAYFFCKWSLIGCKLQQSCSRQNWFGKQITFVVEDAGSENKECIEGKDNE